MQNRGSSLSFGMHKSVGNKPSFLEILLYFFVPSGECNSFYASKNERTVRDYVPHFTIGEGNVSRRESSISAGSGAIKNFALIIAHVL